MAKKHIVIAAVAASALLLAGCSTGGGGSTGGTPSGQITVITHRTDLVQDKTFAGYVKAFEKIYPKVTVKVQGITDLDGQITTRLSTGNYGDVTDIPSTVTPNQLPQFFESIGETAKLKDEYRFLNDKSYKGKQYGLAPFGNAGGFIYNKKVWKEAGVTGLPKTPDEFITDLKAIKSKTSAIPYYTNYKDGWPLGQFQNQQGFTGNATVVADRDKNKAPWTQGTEQYTTDALLYNIVHNGLSEPDPTTTAWEGSKGLMATGKLGAMLLGSWAVVQFQAAAKDAGTDPADIGFMPMPYQKDGKFHSTIGGDVNLGVNNHSKNKTAALAWVNWFASKSTYAADSGALSPLVGSKNPSTLQDFTDANVQFVELDAAKNPTLDSDIYNKAQIDLFGMLYRQKLVDIARGAAPGDMKSYFADLNKQWADAVASVKA
jgi:raffinose/stachyose/melibiose transport system substrate-binding protein